ncbi:hypothetical protein D9M71_731480 [compost metagenome]
MDGRGFAGLGHGRSLGCSRRGHLLLFFNSNFIFGTRGRGLLQGNFGGITLDEHALLAHFDLNRARAAGGVGLPDLGRLAARQGDLLAFGRAVGAAQRFEQFRLVAVGDGIVHRFEVNASRAQLIQQHIGRHFQLGSELGDGVTRH